MRMKIILYSMAFLAIFFVQDCFAFSAGAQNAHGKVLPRIDDEAASTVREYSDSISLSKEKDAYPQNFWVFLFGTYVFLMIFNLSFDLEKKKKLQWFFEAILTFLAIFLWDNLDITRDNSWFPAVVLESGIIIYAFYGYFFRKKLLDKRL